MKIRSYSHATFQFVTDSGTRLLTDPWLYNPIYGNMMWQFPGVTIPLAEYVDQDAIYISHDHPDHFCESTLAHFDRSVRVYIRRYPEFVPMRSILSGMGFRTIIELSDKECVRLDDTTELSLLADPANTDSALIISDGERTVLNQNDCKLNDDGWRWVGENQRIDLSIQCYGATNLFPAAYEMSPSEKQAALARRSEHQLSNALRCARLTRSPRVLPAANDMAYPTRPDLDPYYAPLAVDFAHYARAADAPFEVVLISPGDMYAFEPAADNPPFRDRAGFAAALERLRQAPEVRAFARDLDRWERSYRFDSPRFEALFAGYLREAQSRSMTVHEPDRTLEIELVIDDPEASLTYRLSYGPGEKTFTRVASMEQKNREPFMTVTIDAHLLEMAMRGAYVFEDLMNCRWRVKRNGDYCPSEASFWAFLTAFSTYLRSAGEQPDLDAREKMKFLPGESAVQAIG